MSSYLSSKFQSGELNTELFKRIGHVAEALSEIPVFDLICNKVIHRVSEIHLIKVAKHLIELLRGVVIRRSQLFRERIIEAIEKIPRLRCGRNQPTEQAAHTLVGHIRNANFSLSLTTPRTAQRLRFFRTRW